MANQDFKTMSVVLPGAGGSNSYQLVPDAQVKFDFDLSDAVFSNQDGDLVITVENGGSVVLEDYLSLAKDGNLPTFEMQDGEQMPGDFYMFAFEQSGSQDAEPLETAAEGQSGGSGAGAYSDDAGTIGDGLDALGDQGDAFAPRTAMSLTEVPQEEALEPVEPVEGPDTPVQIVLNPGFEGGEGYDFGYNDFRAIRYDDGGGMEYRYPIYAPYVDHWNNDMDDWGDFGEFSILGPVKIGGPIGPGGPFGHFGPFGGDNLQVWGGEGDGRYMELDSTWAEGDTLTQAIAVQEGDAATISFTFSPMQHAWNLGTNNFKLFLGEQEVATISWQDSRLDDGNREWGEDGIWIVTLGDGVTLPVGHPLSLNDQGDYYFLNNGVEWEYTNDQEVGTRTWTELAFTVTAPEDHAELRFVEDVNNEWVEVEFQNGNYSYTNEIRTGGEGDDSQGAFIDNVSVYRDFDTVIADQSDYILERLENGDIQSFSDVIDYLGDNIEPILGTSGDDAIFGDAPGENDFRPILDGQETGVDTVDLDVINAGAGDDAIYAGNGVNLLWGGSGDDFMQGGRGVNLMAGEEGNDFLSGGRGLNILVGGQGDDKIVAGEGPLDGLIIDKDVSETGEVELSDGLINHPAVMAFNSANIIITGEGNDMVELGDGADILFVSRSVLEDGVDGSVIVENFVPYRTGPLTQDFLVLGEDVEVLDYANNDELGGLDIVLGLDSQANGDTTTVTLLGFSEKDMPMLEGNNILSNPDFEIGRADFDAEDVNQLIQQIINSGGDLGGGGLNT